MSGALHEPERPGREISVLNRTGTLTIGMVERTDKAGPCPIPSKGGFYKTLLAYQNMQYPADPRSCAACKVLFFCESLGF